MKSNLNYRQAPINKFSLSNLKFFILVTGSFGIVHSDRMQNYDLNDAMVYT